jgi:hypothetical protein
MRAYTSRLKKAATQKAEAEQRLEVAKKMKVSKAEYNSAQESVRHAITSFDSAKFRAEEASELLNAVHSAKRQKKEAGKRLKHSEESMSQTSSIADKAAAAARAAKSLRVIKAEYNEAVTRLKHATATWDFAKFQAQEAEERRKNANPVLDTLSQRINPLVTIVNLHGTSNINRTKNILKRTRSSMVALRVELHEFIQLQQPNQSHHSSDGQSPKDMLHALQEAIDQVDDPSRKKRMDKVRQRSKGRPRLMCEDSTHGNLEEIRQVASPKYILLAVAVVLFYFKVLLKYD